MESSLSKTPISIKDGIVSIPFGDLHLGTLVSRPNRFLAVVNVNGKIVEAHVSDPGRLEELLFSGNKVMVRHINPNSEAKKSTRKTAYDLVLAAFEDIWVCVDTRYPNDIFEVALRKRVLREFSGYTQIQREVTFERAISLIDPERNTNFSQQGLMLRDDEKTSAAKKTPTSRFDFLLMGPKCRPFLLEVKSVNLCIDGIGLFPDAPTKRGARHVRELAALSSPRMSTGVMFIAQREDVTKVTAHRKMDPKFAGALDEAQEAGVKVMAVRCIASPKELRLDPQPIPYVKHVP
ncbi:MAG: DNA/RNA nuclease SfsA [Firmicutes bacterium]|nr:DNA/RNA nuclease SfsA [Candidatus Fermentithermobacillaceae bacterium]